MPSQSHQLNSPLSMGLANSAESFPNSFGDISMQQRMNAHHAQQYIQSQGGHQLSGSWNDPSAFHQKQQFMQ